MAYSITPKPEDVQKAQDLLQGVLETCEAVLPKDDSYEVMISASPYFESEAYSSELFAVRFDPGEEWEEEIKSIAARGYAESWFLEYQDDAFHWEQLLRLGHSLKFAEHITSHQPETHDKDELEAEWSEMREELGEPVNVEVELFRQYGFSLAYILAEKLLEEHGFEEFPELTRTHVVNAGDSVFG